ncbi:MAG: hypothetical protein R3E12_01130 [Candidatus Eisenbacteria bacterium]
MTAPRASTRTAKKLTKADRLRREKAIVGDIKAGTLSYRQIAQKYGVSLPTVNNKARKAGISRGRRKGAKILVKGPRPGRTAKRATRRTATAAPRAASAGTIVAGNGSFQEAFRALVLEHYPNISLREFDRLSQAVERIID